MYVHIQNKYQRLFVYAIKTTTECTTYIHTYKDIKNCVTLGLFTTKLSRGPYTQKVQTNKKTLSSVGRNLIYPLHHGLN